MNDLPSSFTVNQFQCYNLTKETALVQNNVVSSELIPLNDHKVYVMNID